MRTYKMVLFLVSFIFCSFLSEAQNYKFYLRTINPNFTISLTLHKGELIYNGTDKDLKKVFDNNTIYTFRNAFQGSTKSTLQRTWYVESNSSSALSDFLTYASNLFEYGEVVEDLILTNTYPNDYGTTGPSGTNQGISADLGYFDFIGVPEAWDYTTGSSNISNIRVGISDGGITETDNDFSNQIIPNGVLSTTTSTGDISHGNTVSMILAGEGDNMYGSTGICQDCEIVTHYFQTDSNMTSFEKLMDLAMNGARVINCSWIGGNSDCLEDVIEEITGDDYGVIVVAAAGNGNSEDIWYPASYDNVISVGGVGSGKDFTFASIEPPVTGSIYYTIKNLKNALGGNIGFTGTTPPTPADFQNRAFILGGRAIMNEKVDIMAPGGKILRYGAFLDGGGIQYTPTQTFFTSPATPMVSGTIALMLDLNQCLKLPAVESILKITSTYISESNFNRNSGGNFMHTGKHGSGTLHTGRAVKLVNDLLDPTETAYLENQKISRWDFEFKGVSEKIEIRNLEFTEGATLNVLAKNRILIEEASLIEPNVDGNALLEIDPSLALDITCDPPGFNGPVDPSEGNDTRQEELVLYRVYPTKVNSSITVEKIGEVTGDMSKIVVYDLFNRIVYSNDTLESLRNNGSMSFDLSGLKRGIYIVKGYAFDNEEIITEKVIKD